MTLVYQRNAIHCARHAISNENIFRMKTSIKLYTRMSRATNIGLVCRRHYAGYIASYDSTFTVEWEGSARQWSVLALWSNFNPREMEIYSVFDSTKFAPTWVEVMFRALLVPLVERVMSNHSEKFSNPSWCKHGPKTLLVIGLVYIEFDSSRNVRTNQLQSSNLSFDCKGNTRLQLVSCVTKENM